MSSALLERLSVAIKACSEDELEQLQKLPQPRFSENYFGAWRTSGGPSADINRDAADTQHARLPEKDII